MVYLYKECGWADERLKNYKNDKGYKLFTANHISDVEMCIIKETPYVYLKAACIPETRQNEHPYMTWILLHTSGRVQTSGCTCVADDGTCKHCVALLFAVRNFIERHKDSSSEACTDTYCVWDKPRKTSVPSEIMDIDIRKDQSSPPAVFEATPDHFDPRSVGDFNSRNVEKQFYKLFKGSNSLILQTIDPPSDDSECGSDDEMNDLVIPTMSQAMKSHTPGQEIESHLRSVFTEKVISDIELATKGQSENEAWYVHRQGRLTASLFSSVLHFRFSDKPENYILKMVMSLGGDNIRSPSLSFGKDHEPVARHLYVQEASKEHMSLNVQESGLFVDMEHPYIGASPDGLVSCSCCGKGLLEIKCSFTYQNVDPIQACNDNNYHVYCDENGSLRLKCSSSWYVQIQGQMGVCKYDWCDFVFYTKKGIAVDRIKFDPNMYTEIISKCKKFFETYVLRNLL
ncbi:hypothetical protein FSP39_005730 [Pinctada imbricata]|uniref:SWIM-type domain-containing protein n=1 Tax=Pinctada imbricata TaxID=66713 RepID=A0AA88XG93_PINIB|nr:hypothetical protein FSP39_005730 [Pinctada imbricata]